jgi:hypothetical protein
MAVDKFCSEVLPQGSGFDCKWEWIKDQKNGSRVFETFYHNMNEHGYYDGYTKLRLTVPHILEDFRLTLVGKTKYTDYKTREYMVETIYNHLQGLTVNWED